MAAVLAGCVLQVVPVRVNQERVVNPQNQLVTKDANIFQKQQNQYQSHTNVLLGEPDARATKHNPRTYVQTP